MQLNFSECRSKRDTPYLFPQTKGILNALKDGGIDIAIASKSPTPDIATTYLDKLSIRSMFVAEVRYLLNLINLQLKYYTYMEYIVVIRFPSMLEAKFNSFFMMMILQEIFYSWTHKTDHFQKIHSGTGVPYNSMLFFDDDNNNIQGVIN